MHRCGHGLMSANTFLPKIYKLTNRKRLMQCRFADTPEEKARKLAKKTSLPSSKLTSYDLLQSLAGQYQLTMDGVHPGLPAGFAGFSATGVPDGASEDSVHPAS